MGFAKKSRSLEWLFFIIIHENLCYPICCFWQRFKQHQDIAYQSKTENTPIYGVFSRLGAKDSNLY